MQLKVKNLSLSFGQKQVLKNLNFDLNSGGLIGLIGPNSAGKSTLLKVLSTILKADNGSIFLNGTDITRKPKVMRQVLGYMPQKVPFYPHLSAMEYLQYVAALKGLPAKASKEQIKSLLVKFHLGKVGRQKLGNFSGGMLQRVGISATLLGDPKVIIVDEPTAGLDPMERVIIRNVLSELASTRIVLLSTHIISDIEAVASKLIVLKSGRIKYQGSADGLLDEVKDYVWEYVLPTGENPEQLANVSSIVQAVDGIHVRVVSKSAPNPQAKNVQPRLEDASLAILEGGDH